MPFSKSQGMAEELTFCTGGLTVITSTAEEIDNTSIAILRIRKQRPGQGKGLALSMVVPAFAQWLSVPYQDQTTVLIVPIPGSQPVNGVSDQGRLWRPRNLDYPAPCQGQLQAGEADPEGCPQTCPAFKVQQAANLESGKR